MRKDFKCQCFWAVSPGMPSMGQRASGNNSPRLQLGPRREVSSTFLQRGICVPSVGPAGDECHPGRHLPPGARISQDGSRYREPAKQGALRRVRSTPHTTREAPEGEADILCLPLPAGAGQLLPRGHSHTTLPRAAQCRRLEQHG